MKVVNLVEVKEIIDDQVRNSVELDTAKNIEKRHNIAYKMLMRRSRIVLGKNLYQEFILILVTLALPK